MSLLKRTECCIDAFLVGSDYQFGVWVVDCLSFKEGLNSGSLSANILKNFYQSLSKFPGLSGEIRFRSKFNQDTERRIRLIDFCQDDFFGGYSLIKSTQVFPLNREATFFLWTNERAEFKGRCSYFFSRYFPVFFPFLFARSPIHPRYFLQSVHCQPWSEFVVWGRWMVTDLLGTTSKFRMIDLRRTNAIKTDIYEVTVDSSLLLSRCA